MNEDTLEKTLWKLDLLNQAVRGIAHRGASGDIKDVDDETWPVEDRHQGRSRARHQRLRAGVGAAGEIAMDFEQRKREIEERADKRPGDTAAALKRLRDDYINGALADQRDWPGRDSRTYKTAAGFDNLFAELVDHILNEPPIGLSVEEWRAMQRIEEQRLS